MGNVNKITITWIAVLILIIIDLQSEIILSQGQDISLQLEFVGHEDEVTPLYAVGEELLVRAIILNNTEDDISLDKVSFWLFSAPGDTNIVNENEKKGWEYKFDIANFESFPMILIPKKQSLIFYTRSFNRQILRENKINSEAIGTWKFQLYLEANGRTFPGTGYIIEIVSKEKMEEIQRSLKRQKTKDIISDISNIFLISSTLLTLCLAYIRYGRFELEHTNWFPRLVRIYFIILGFTIFITLTRINAIFNFLYEFLP